MAGQLKSFTNLIAAKSMAIVRTILTISHNKNPKTAAPELMLLVLLVMPRANNAAGTTTDKAP